MVVNIRKTFYQYWRPNQYHKSIWNSSIIRTYEVVKIIDYKEKEKILQQSVNPFGLVVLAQLAAIETRSDQEARLISKMQLFRYLLERKWSTEKIKNYGFQNGEIHVRMRPHVL